MTEHVQHSVTSRTRLMQTIGEEMKRSLSTEGERGAMKLIGLNIQSIPPEALELMRDSVERLSLQNNSLTLLPQYFSRLEKLRYLDIHENDFTVFPDVLAKMPDLEILDISCNRLNSLPSDIGNLSKLKVLSLKNNQFETIPSSILQMKDLRILELENNPFNQNIMSFLSKIPYKPQTLEWLQEIKMFLRTHSSAIVEEEEEEEETGVKPEGNLESHTMEEQGELDLDDPLHPIDNVNVRSSDASAPQHKPLERSRSISDTHISSRAAKRMGFINVKKPISEEDDEIPGLKRNRSLSANAFSQSSMIQPVFQQTPIHNHISQQGTNDTETHITPPKGEQPLSIRIPTALELASPIAAEKLDSIPEHRSNDYFKRLSTLPETRSNLTQLKIVDIARKVLFAFSEFQSTMKKMNTFCTDKQLIIDMVSQLYFSKNLIEHLVESLEKSEAKNKEGLVSVDEILKVVTETVSSFKKMIETLSMNLTSYTKNTDNCFKRMLLLSLFMCYSEILNAYNILAPDITKKDKVTARNQLPSLRIPESNMGITQQQLAEYKEVDDNLYDSLNNVLQSSNDIYAELNEAISKSAIANAKSEDHQLSATAIQRIKELTGTCVSSMDQNKKIKIKLGNTKNLTIPDKKKFYDELNTFLKSIITILASTKAIMNESPILNEVRPSLASLTKATKDVTIMLEVSSYRMINDSFSALNSAVPQSTATAPMISSIPSVMSIPQMNTPFVNMPSASTPMQTASNPFEASMVNNMQSMSTTEQE
ncbi:unnamed protein product [Cyberlindnera jadinii]|uniref:L domain-like protein n=1 Tax=Cyberlindnera jadinii (strain ATCC 18201 / CBS 1600 / BCRC 20928 / JCM 3617 / NBRC 0987 / NRRL Y-1542) TaxID=983966 RepID=A0A0H5C7R8_CYBJN|nr:unnamed protein product [Cyberlindnera jadinii]